MPAAVLNVCQAQPSSSSTLIESIEKKRVSLKLDSQFAIELERGWKENWILKTCTSIKTLIFLIRHCIYFFLYFLPLFAICKGFLRLDKNFGVPNATRCVFVGLLGVNLLPAAEGKLCNRDSLYMLKSETCVEGATILESEESEERLDKMDIRLDSSPGH
ncbi:hypothetical protein OUZ56_000059 [Daphnia magna]|uniref:Uncharacterized protein n=1 Tax=Daphnia magna TaxID=35525 RepID=A0ABQ9ZYK2_9CRUS|nr:hypothetical protein OUZ56_000059 [Daphnia magna]